MAFIQTSENWRDKNNTLYVFKNFKYQIYKLNGLIRKFFAYK